MADSIIVSGVPYTDNEVPDLQFVQSNDVMFIVHANHPPAVLARFSDTDWRYVVSTFSNGPYLDSAEDDQDISLWVKNIVDRQTLKSTNPADFVGLVANNYVEYAIESQYSLGLVVTAGAGTTVIQPLPERSFVLAKEIYSPGFYAGWDTPNNKPTYTTPIVVASGQSVAFSNSHSVTRPLIGNFLRFVDKSGVYWWMKVTGVSDILEQGAYGIIATGDVLTVFSAAGNVTRSARSLTCTIQSSAGTGSGFFSATDDPGRPYRLNFNDHIVHARVATVANDYQVAATLSSALPLSAEGVSTVLNSSTSDWRRGAWYPSNYPSTVGIHEERLVLGGVPNSRETLYLSRSAEFTDYATTNESNQVLDDSAITVTVAADTMNSIQWITTDVVMLVGTSGGEWQVSSGNARDALTPTNITATRQSAFGSSLAQAISIGRATFFVQRGSRKLREMTFDFSADRFVSLDVTVFAEHILRNHGGAVQVAYAQLPESILYVLCADGQVCALTYEPDQKVYSWSRIIVGGPSAVVTSIATKLEDNEDVLYLLVDRDGVRSLEKMLTTYEPESPTDFSAMRFLDCYVDIPVSDITAQVISDGLSVFAGRTVTAMLDNVQYDDLSVGLSGVLTLPVQPVTSCIVGYAYRSLFESFPLETPGRRGTTQGKIKTVHNLTLRCRNTMGFMHGVRDTELTQEPVPSAHVTDDIRVPLPNNYDTRGTYIIAQTKAYPLTILALYPEVALQQ